MDFLGGREHFASCDDNIQFFSLYVYNCVCVCVDMHTFCIYRYTRLCARTCICVCIYIQMHPYMYIYNEEHIYCSQGLGQLFIRIYGCCMHHNMIWHFWFFFFSV